LLTTEYYTIHEKVNVAEESFIAHQYLIVAASTFYVSKDIRLTCNAELDIY